jgi:hypothetical protein
LHGHTPPATEGAYRAASCRACLEARGSSIWLGGESPSNMGTSRTWEIQQLRYHGDMHQQEMAQKGQLWSTKRVDAGTGPHASKSGFLFISLYTLTILEVHWRLLYPGACNDVWFGDLHLLVGHDPTYPTNNTPRRKACSQHTKDIQRPNSRFRPSMNINACWLAVSMVYETSTVLSKDSIFFRNLQHLV